MKRLAVLAAVMLATSVAAFGAATTVQVIWDAYGGPGLTVDFFNGNDSNSQLFTGGSHYWGQFDGKDADDNPYSYSVDSGTFQLKASIAGGGRIDYGVTRTDSWSSMYGPPGQISYSHVWSADGTGYLAQQTTTNYAGARNCNYGFVSNNQFQAAGSSFGIVHGIMSGDGDGAQVSVLGSGSATVTYMSDEMGGTSFLFGHGCGCYNNCGAAGTGSGMFELAASAAHSLAGSGWTAPSGGTYLQQVNYTGGFTVTDPYVSGN